jgi:hypothetical protein
MSKIKSLLIAIVITLVLLGLASLFVMLMDECPQSAIVILLVCVVVTFYKKLREIH